MERAVGMGLLGLALVVACSERAPEAARPAPGDPPSAAASASEREEEAPGGLPPSPPRAKTGLEALVERFGGLGLERQWHLNEALKLGGEVRLDLGGGRLVLSDEAALDVQVLGVVDRDGWKWTWAWAEEAPEVPEGLLALARELRALGEAEGLERLAAPRHDLEENLTFAIGVVAAGFEGYDGWYFAPSGAHTLLVAVRTEAVALPPPTTRQLSAVFMELIDRFNVDHRRAMAGYLEARGFEVSEGDGQHDGAEGTRLVARRGGRTLVASFDAAGRWRGLRTVETSD